MNVTKLLKKELKLESNISMYIWIACLALFYYIPGYPMYVGCFYITLAVMMTFTLNQLSHGLLYTVLLPVRKIDTVKARFLYCALLEILFVPFAVLAAFVRWKCGFNHNPAGIEINVAYMGFQFIILAIFNIVFLGAVYKNPLKPGKPYFISAILYFITFAIAEIPVWASRSTIVKLRENGLSPDQIMSEVQKTGDFLIKFGAIITRTDFDGQLKQIPILIAGLLFFILSWPLSFKRAANKFEKYDM